MEISFKHTYQIPLTGPKLSQGKVNQLVEWVVPRYPGHFKLTNKYLKLSIPEDDNAFEQKLRQIGFKIYQKFFKHNLPENEIEKYIASVFTKNEPYKQFGKQPKARR